VSKLADTVNLLGCARLAWESEGVRAWTSGIDTKKLRSSIKKDGQAQKERQ